MARCEVTFEGIIDVECETPENEVALLQAVQDKLGFTGLTAEGILYYDVMPADDE